MPDSQPASFLIEPARDEDVPAVVELLGELFGIEQDFHADLSKQVAGIALLRRHPNRAAVLVARDEHGRVLGLITGQIVFSTAEGAPSVWVEDMIVRRSHRRLGLGRALLTSIEHWAHQHGASRLQLLVDTDNAAALAFYDRLTWSPTHLVVRRRMLRGDV